MKEFLTAAAIVAIIYMAGFAPLYNPAHAEVLPGDLIETRTGAADTTSRSSAVLHAFRRIHPCPSTLTYTGPCPNWNIDHVVPRACGGRDAVSNLQWLPVSIKRTSDPDNKDRWERKVYCYPRNGVVLPQ